MLDDDERARLLRAAARGDESLFEEVDRLLRIAYKARVEIPDITARIYASIARQCDTGEEAAQLILLSDEIKKDFRKRMDERDEPLD